MDKKECIKILRSVQNELKEQKRNNSFKQKMLSNINFEKNIDNDMKTKKKHIVMLFSSFFLYTYTINNLRYYEWSKIPEVCCIMCLFTMLLADFNCRFANYFIKKRDIELDKINRLSNNITSNISSIEYAIEFLNSLTKEEEEKYLKFKLN